MSDSGDNGQSNNDNGGGRQYLGDLAPGSRADAAFIIQNVQLKTNKRGEPYLTMQVRDRTRAVTGNWWDRGEQMFRRLPNPGVVRVKGTVEEFNGNPQLKIDNILQIRDSSQIDYSELLPSTEKDVAAVFAEVEAMLRDLKSPTLRGLAGAYLADGELMEKFRRAPAAMSFHHAYLGGLLEHTHNAMRAAALLAPLYPGLNGDLCVFGVFVHDLAKTWELSYDTAFDYSDGGRLVGHVVKSAMWVEDKARDAAAAGTPVPREVVDAVQHLILEPPRRAVARVRQRPQPDDARGDLRPPRREPGREDDDGPGRHARRAGRGGGGVDAVQQGAGRAAVPAGRGRRRGRAVAGAGRIGRPGGGFGKCRGQRQQCPVRDLMHP